MGGGGAGWWLSRYWQLLSSLKTWVRPYRVKKTNSCRLPSDLHTLPWLTYESHTHTHTHTQNKWKCNLKIKTCFGFVPDTKQRVFQKQLGHLKKSEGFLYITENWLQWPLTTDEGEELVPKLAQIGEIQEKETRTNRRELKGGWVWRLKEEEVLLHWWVNPVFRAFVNKWNNT